LPRILAENHADLIAGKLRLDAIVKYAEIKGTD
jgi:hypothetical protein